MTEKKSTNKKTSTPKTRVAPLLENGNKKKTSSAAKKKSTNTKKPSVVIRDAESSLHEALGDVSSVSTAKITPPAVVKQKWFDKLIKKLLG